MIDLTQARDEPQKVIDDIIEACSDYRQLFMQDWVRNFRRLAAFTEHDVRERRTAEVSSSDNQGQRSLNKRYVTSFNTTRGFYQRLLGRLTPALVKFQVMAASNEKIDKLAARCASALLGSRTAVDSGQDFESYARAISYLFCGGPAYIRVEGIEEDNDVETAPVFPFDVFYYPGVLDHQKSPALVLVERLTRQEIERRFPELAEAIKKREGGWENLPGAEWPKDVDFGHIANGLNKGLYEVVRLMILPCADFEKGYEWVMIDRKQEVLRVSYEELRTADKKYPIEAFHDVPMGPFMEDRGRMTTSSRAQGANDIIVSKLLDNALGAPSSLLNLPPGGTQDDDITNQATCITHAFKGQEPTWMPNPGSEQLFKMKAMVDDFTADVHGQHGPSRGVMPGSRTSGRALEEVITADEAIDTPLMALVRRTMGRVGKRILMEGKRVWSKSYVFRVLGKHGYYETQAFMSADLKDGFDVRVLPDQGLPQNRAARMKLVIQGLKEGLWSDTPEARNAREMLSVQVDGDLYERDKIEDQMIAKEEESFGLGDTVEPTPINWSDNHASHLEKHKANDIERRSRGPGELTPEVWGAILMAAEAHAKLHSDKIAESMTAQMNLAQPQGAGTAPPQA